MRNPFHTTRRPATRPEPARWPRSDTPLFDKSVRTLDDARQMPLAAIHAINPQPSDAHDALLAELDLLAGPISTGTLGPIGARRMGVTA